MPRAAQVTLCYGPYGSNGAVQHRSSRLQGLQGTFVQAVHVLCIRQRDLGSNCPPLAALEASRHQCVLEETSARRRVELVVNGMVVFTCDVKQLHFGETLLLWPRFGRAAVPFYFFSLSLFKKNPLKGGDGKLDPLCKEAVAAVENAY